ncbi:MAG: proteasome accessory factor PafA2 family protein [Terracidiphilus sp.]
MAELLFGAETEYAVAGRGRKRAIPSESAASVLMGQASKRLTHLPDMSASSGLYLGNGARLYIDCGTHPEYCTPECSNPWDVVRHIEAGHRILAGLASAAKEGGTRSREILCFRSNVDYSGTLATWGAHESYLHKNDQDLLLAQLLPHLVTRPIYTGAGGFSPKSRKLEFTLSPRLTYFDRATADNSTSERGIFHFKTEPLSNGYQRLHVICGESLCSQTALFLKFGVTALIVAMADAGLTPGAAVQMAEPVAMLQTVLSDVSGKALLAMTGNRPLTAIDVQRHYLEMAEAHANDEFMPVWAVDVCRVWREILDRLETGPETVAKTLDWAIKWSIYASEARKIHLQPLTRLDNALPFEGPADLDDSLQSSSEPESGLDFGPEVETESGTPENAPPRNPKLTRMKMLRRARKRMLEIDMRFGQLGAGGIFEMLDQAGVLDHRLVAAEGIERAMTESPESGRAHVRGRVIQRLAGSANARCDWQAIVNFDQKTFLDLTDPFTREENWRQLTNDDVYSGRPRRLFEVVDPAQDGSSWSESRHPLARRERAYNLYETGDYAGAEELIRGCIADGFEPGSNFCHLARVLTMMDREPEAREEVAHAWAAREGAATYVEPRILFFRCIFAALDGLPLSDSVAQIKAAFEDGGGSSDWTIEPLLNHLRSRLGEESYRFLKTLAEGLSDSRNLRRLEEFAQWRDAAEAAPVAG